MADKSNTIDTASAVIPLNQTKLELTVKSANPDADRSSRVKDFLTILIGLFAVGATVYVGCSDRAEKEAARVGDINQKHLAQEIDSTKRFFIASQQVEQAVNNLIYQRLHKLPASETNSSMADLVKAGTTMDDSYIEALLVDDKDLADKLNQLKVAEEKAIVAVQLSSPIEEVRGDALAFGTAETTFLNEARSFFNRGGPINVTKPAP